MHTHFQMQIQEVEDYHSKILELNKQQERYVRQAGTVELAENIF